ncbi:cytochrome d ubiquinol oxidase subunit II [Chenggangzhangella methanolivorans]|uniref:Cytochrome d ubiquinol oxidase subunit II n=1 Tax=Chenggangzhangella methanolivorans TaxID=1437009 RepID=A0A9E6R8R6_9HYPH|nr:cytochrome d ubiquinol oxidase subunit II [Chenggangzhangella methanolivorans]QZN98898.1 cytochrome d ubiquinol oxidase subunit II [Chenggangzhangella methanolivorans]
MTLDYETLRVVWWVLLGALLIGFAVMDGFDLGVATLLPFVARTDGERRVAINTVGPVWEGNQVWLVLGAGAIFAAWPALYAAAFSGFYLAMFVVLWALILRPVGFKFRSKVLDRRWRAFWDWALFTGGFVPALIFGVAVGNALQGVPFRFDDELRMTYEGGFFGLLNPFALFCGVVSVTMLVMHGGTYLALKAEEPVASRAAFAARQAALLLIIGMMVGGVCMALGIDSYRIVGKIDPAGPSNPLLKSVDVSVGRVFASYAAHLWMLAAPAAALAGAAVTGLLLTRRPNSLAFVSSAVSVAGVVATAGVSLFPFLLPSSIAPNQSLTVWDASSSEMTLKIMLAAIVIFLPIIVAYTAWVYRVLRGRVTLAAIRSDTSAY